MSRNLPEQIDEGFYYNKVKEKLTDMVENHGLRDMHFSWGDEAYKMSLEERCKWWLEFMESLENGDYDDLTFESDFPETEHKINVHDYFNILDNQDWMLHNPHMEA